MTPVSLVNGNLRDVLTQLLPGERVEMDLIGPDGDPLVVVVIPDGPLRLVAYERHDPSTVLVAERRDFAVRGASHAEHQSLAPFAQGAPRDPARQRLQACLRSGSITAASGHFG